MKPAFHSWSQFFAMGGYSFYVWLSVSVAVVILLSLIVHTLVQRRGLLKAIAAQQAREQRILSAKQRKKSAGEHS